MLHFISLGCPRNLVDTEVMLGIAKRHGYDFTDRIEAAQYIVINTCGFLKSARQEACDVLKEVFAEKRADAKVIVAGCMVKEYRGHLRELFPEIYYFIGSGNVDSILEALSSATSGECVTGTSYLQKKGEERLLSTPGHYAYLKVAEGCLKRCTYCSIPTIKGALVSRKVEDVKEEFSSLLDRGIFEVILIAQDLGDFGKDKKDKTENVKSLIGALLKDPREFWLRLMYIYPDEIDDELIDLIDSDDRICNYLDMPIQHADDEILKRMGRKTSRAEIEEVIAKLRSRIPDMVIRTSLITGFPGETEAQHLVLKEFIEEQKLDNIGIFKYSQEAFTLAAKFEGQIEEKEKERRYNELMEAQQQIAININGGLIGYQIPVVIDSIEEDVLVARTYGQCPDVDGTVLISNIDIDYDIITGQICLAEIREVDGYDLIADIIEVFED